MPELVKGAGCVTTDEFGFRGKPIADPTEVMRRSFAVEESLRDAVKTGLATPVDGLRKSLSPSFASEFGSFLSGSPMYGGLADFASQVQTILQTELGKNITLTSPLASGLVPYDLLAPSRLIYPFFSPLRNKLPRPAGQGTSRRAKLVTGVSGSPNPGAPAVIDISIAELAGGSFSNWPINLPGSGSQNAVDMNIPYKFFGMTEAISWLSQFAGQGFEDVAALANLILLQEGMMAEEYQIMYGTGTALSAPGTPTLAARNAGAGETALTGTGDHVYVVATAANAFGETVKSSTANVAYTSGTSVVDVTLPAVPAGAAWWNVYINCGTSDPGTYYRFKTNIGGVKFTLQGAIPTGGTTPPTADTGTSGSNRYEGLFSVISGHAASASVYPSGFQGYVNANAAKTLGHSVLEDALAAMWDGTGTGQGFRADPAECWLEGNDRRRLSDDILNANAAGLNYRIQIAEGGGGGATAGMLVSGFLNPITGSPISLVVHPMWPQGTVHLLSYTLPTTFSQVSNVWENVMVQDYLSIGWPVIDLSFRYSLFFYGALVCYAPQYNGIIQGLQNSASTPYS